jgi:CBS domain-containing protein
MSITPSPALVVRADASIADVIRLMNRHDVGSVLVRSDKEDSDALIGIFTERDLLKRVALIESGRHWNRPVRTVMSQPVETLELSQWRDAAQVLLKKRFRHLPILHQGKLIGVVSIRDVLEWAAKGHLTPTSKPPLQPRKIGALAAMPDDLRGILRLMDTVDGEAPQTITWLQSTDPLPPHLDLLLLDLDGLTRKQWSPWIRAILASRGPKQTLLFFDPLKHPKTLSAALGVLEKTKKVTLYPKPMALFPLATQLSRR